MAVEIFPIHPPVVRYHCVVDTVAKDQRQRTQNAHFRPDSVAPSMHGTGRLENPRFVSSLYVISRCTANDGTEEAVDCTGDSWQYQAADGAWKTEVSFPTNGDDEFDPNSVAFEGFLSATGDGGITVSGIPASIATAVSDSLYGRPVRLNLTCHQESAVVEEEESCVIFMVDFTNYSPAFNVNMALYRFKGKVQQKPVCRGH